MPRIDINGIGIAFEFHGDAGAPAAVITPGGRYPMDTPGVPQLAQAIADAGFRVLRWDRPNCGASDICFDAPSESALHADVLGKLLRALDLRDVGMLGGSAGSRVSLLTAAANPDLVSRLAIWWITGEPISLAQIAAYYCGDSAIAASRGGMEAVAKLPGWADQIAKNPKNREILLALDPDAFIARQQQWAAAYGYDPSNPVPGMSAADYARVAMPTLVFRSGKSDLSHTRRTSEWVSELLPNARLVEPPWPDTEWNDVSLIPNAPGRGRFERWPLLAPQLIAFLREGR